MECAVYPRAENKIKGKTMEIKFNWVAQINSSLKKSAEQKIKQDIEDSDSFEPCHEGPVWVSILSADALEVSIKGNISCQCGKELATFSGASDGSTLKFEFPS